MKPAWSRSPIAVVAALAMTLAAPVSRSAETIRMIAVDSYSASSLWVKVFVDYFIPEVDRRLAATGRYEIDWNPAFGGTIAKSRGVLDSLQYDIADIGIITTPTHTDKVPLYNLPMATPLVSNDVGLIARTMNDLHDKYPALRKAWSDYRVVYLTTAGAIDTYNLLLTRPYGKPGDLRGRKIGGVGSNLRYLEGSGAAGVTSGLSDWYNSLATGLLDGILVWNEAVVGYKLYEVAPYLLDVQFGGATTKAIVVNERTWNRLPQEVRTVLQDVAIGYRDQLARETDRIASVAKQVFHEKGGKTIPLSTEERAAWAAALPDLAEEWVAQMERRGLPGRQILGDYMQAMRNAGQPVVRHWDRE